MVPLPQTSQLVVRFLAYRISTTGGGGGAHRPREQGSGHDLRQDYDDQQRGFDSQQRASRMLIFNMVGGDTNLNLVNQLPSQAEGLVLILEFID
ncbi:hypothetical protein PVAP13_9NG382600 [Panicum virgatum]|uniref:Uncharacterized protein n=1 Tax=Panicum virgatum TaxID=38727 RepID=A0A8T0ML35_PANVG|nr:hypothetical protein PVAP13_9NG382600 [Panicum virgatum]